MNGNNNENNNEGLNAVSLGNIDNSNQNLNVPISDIPPVLPIAEEPVDALDSGAIENIGVDQNIGIESTITKNVETVPTPIAPETLNNDAIPETPSPVQTDVSVLPTEEPIAPVAPINYDIPEVIDNTPVFNDIGTVPPISDIPLTENIAEPAVPPEPKKKGMNKILFVMIIILSLCLVGGVVYVILSKANAPKVTTKFVKIEAGSTISTDINDYANFKNIDVSTCNFDTSDITDTSVLGEEYKFRVTCGDKTYQGKAIIVDTIAPDITLREVNVGIDEEVTAEDFIADCKDATKCSYAFKDEAKLKEYLKAESSYHVPIIVKDEGGNEKEVTGILKVSSNSITIALVCSNTLDNYVDEIKLGLDEDNNFNKSTMRNYTFKFSSQEEYDKFKEENKDNKEVTYLDITGTPSFDDEALSLVISKKVAYSDLVSEMSSELPSSYGELKEFFSDKAYSCSLGYF